VVFIFGLATFSYGPADEVGRRLAAVQLVTARIATSQEVAAAFGVSGVTLWTWRRDFAAGGVLALVRTRSGPKGPIKLTASLAARIAGLDAGGATLLKIAALTGVSTATVRVALGRVAPRDQVPVEPDVDVDQPKDTAAPQRPSRAVLSNSPTPRPATQARDTPTGAGRGAQEAGRRTVPRWAQSGMMAGQARVAPHRRTFRSPSMIKRPVPLTLTARRTPSKLTYWRTL
jgi:hypothetical protein